MSNDRIETLAEIGNAALRRRWTRRQTLKGAAGLGLAVPLLGAARSRRAAAQDVVTITWFASRDTTGYTPKQVEAFNAAHPTIQISYQEQGAVTTDLHDKFVTIATAEDPSADLISMDVPFVPEFAAAGWTLPVEDLLPAEERSAFFAGTIEGATYDAQLYAVPWFNNGPGLFYRKDLLDGAGLQLPKTYDELLAAARQLQTPEMNGYIFQAAQTEGGLIHWLEYLWGHGGDLVDAENVFVEGRAVFLRQWMTATAAMEADTSQIKGMWDVAPLPSQDGAAPGPGCLGTWNLGISKFSRYPEETAEAIRWLTSLEQQTTRYLGGGFLPARSAVFDDPAVLEKYAYVDRLRAAFESLKPRPVTPYYSQMSADVLQPNFGAAITRQKEPAQAIADMAEGLKQVQEG